MNLQGVLKEIFRLHQLSKIHTGTTVASTATDFYYQLLYIHSESRHVINGLVTTGCCTSTASHGM